MVDVSDISEAGSFVDAVSTNTVNGNASTTIGDNIFTNLASQIAGGSANPNPNSPPSHLATDGTISLTADNLANVGNPFGVPSGAANAAYQNAVGYAAYIGSNAYSGTISFSGLTTGDYYQVEVWCYYSDNRFNPELSGTNSPTLVNGTGQYVLGTFFAPSSTFSFNYSTGSGQAGAVINAVELRNVEDEVPEPSTWLLMGVGLIVVGWAQYRKQRA